MKRIKALAIFNALSLIAQLATVYFVQEKWVNNFSIAEVFRQYESLFTPAPFSFSIWGIIYTALGILCLYHIVIAYKHDKLNVSNIDLERMSVSFLLANLAGVGWLLAWVQERMLYSILFCLVQLICLVIIHIRLHIFDRSGSAASKTCTQFPLSIYLAWVVILTLINVSSYFVAVGWTGWGLTPAQWTLLFITILVGLTLFMIFSKHNIYFAIVVAWVLYGIISKVNSINSKVYEMVINTAWLGFGLVVLSTLIHLFGNRYKRPREIFPSPATPLK